MTLQILTVIIFCVLYFIDMIAAIIKANKSKIINANKPKKHSLIISIINYILFIALLGIGTAWTFNFWGWFLVILIIIAIITNAHCHANKYCSIGTVISGKLIGILLLYLAGFFNCLLL